jgi:hypothetical protein
LAPFSRKSVCWMILAKSPFRPSTFSRWAAKWAHTVITERGDREQI